MSDGKGVDVRAVIKAIEDQFKKIGTEKLPSTVLPSGNRNNSPEAHEFYVADALRKLADARYKAAKEAADASGVFGHEKDYIVGDAIITWTTPGAAFMISVRKGKDTEMVDKTLMTDALVKHCGDEKGRKVLAEGMKPRKGPTTIITAMKG